MKYITILLLPLFVSCATIMAGPTSTVRVTSPQPHVAFRTDTGITGETPAQVVLPNGVPVTFVFDYFGREAQVVSTPGLSPWAAGNLLFGGFLGLIIDAVNKQAHVHSSDLVLTVLTPTQQAIADRKARERAEAEGKY